jgi:hypothetical protein
MTENRLEESLSVCIKLFILTLENHQGVLTPSLFAT